MNREKRVKELQGKIEKNKLNQERLKEEIENDLSVANMAKVGAEMGQDLISVGLKIHENELEKRRKEDEDCENCDEADTATALEKEENRIINLDTFVPTEKEIAEGEKLIEQMAKEIEKTADVKELG
jgi:PHP family Zn ribbon phosphoesterase